MSTTEPEVRSILARFADALAHGDAQDAAACFALDAMYSEPPRFAFAGRTAIAAFFADFTVRHREVSFTVARVLAGPLAPTPSPIGRGGARAEKAPSVAPPRAGSGAIADAPRGAGADSASPPLRGEGPGERLAAIEWRFAYTRTSDGARTVFEGMCWLELAADGLIARWRGFSARVAE